MEADSIADGIDTPPTTPQDWQLMHLGDVATLQRGIDLPRSQRKDGPYPVVGSNGVVGHHAEFRAHGPGVFVGRSGSVGKVTWIEENYWPLNTTLWVKDFHGNDPSFVYYLLSQIDFSRYSAGVSVPTLNRNLVHPIDVTVPPAPEQAAIASILRAVQRDRTATEKVIAAMRGLKRTLLRYLFTYGPQVAAKAEDVELRETEFGPVPAHWSIRPLADCAEIQTGITKGRRLVGADVIDVPYLRVANVQDGYLDLGEIKTIQIRRREIERYKLRSGDILLTEGGDLDKLGRGHIWQGQIDPCVHQNHIFAVRPHGDLLSSGYFSFLIQSPYGKAYFLKVGHRTTNLASINRTKLAGLPVLLPSHEEQSRIVYVLSSADRKLAAEESRRGALSRMYESLVSDLMSGRRRVRQPEASRG